MDKLVKFEDIKRQRKKAEQKAKRSGSVLHAQKGSGRVFVPNSNNDTPKRAMYTKDIIKETPKQGYFKDIKRPQEVPNKNKNKKPISNNTATPIKRQAEQVVKKSSGRVIKTASAPEKDRKASRREAVTPKLHTNIKQRPVAVDDSAEFYNDYSTPKATVKKPKRVPTREEIAARKKRSAAILKLIGLLCCFALVIVIAAFAVKQIFKLKSITVTGSGEFDKKYVIKLSGLKEGVSMFSINENDIEALIETDSYIDATVIKEYPNSIAISVIERNEGAILVTSNGFAKLDENCIVLSISKTDFASKLKRVYGMESTGLSVGCPIASSKDYRTSALISLLSVVNTAKYRDIIASINMANPFAIKLFTYDGMTVAIGDISQLEEKLVNLPMLIEKVKKNNYGAGEIDLSLVGSPRYVVYQTAPLETPNTSPSPTIPQSSDTPNPTETPKPSQTALPTDLPTASPTETPEISPPSSP